MRLRHFNLLILATVVVFSSCSKTNKQGRLIPKDATFVLLADGKSLSSKLTWDEIKANPLLVEAMADSSIPAGVKSILNNPDNSGVDTKADMIFFMEKDSTGGYFAFEGKIKDENLFKTFNKSNGGNESEKDGITFLSKAPVCVGWDKEKFVYVIDAPALSQMDELSRRMKRDSIDISPIYSKRDIDATCKAIFNLEESNSLAKNDKFTTLMKETGDLRFWMNSEEVYKDMGTMLPMINLDKMYKGSATTALVNFENGKISITGESYAGEELTKLYKKYGGGKVNEDMLKRMPGKDIVGMVAINFQPQGLQEFLKLLGVDGFANVGLKNFGFTMEDFVKANKGDIMVGISDLKMQKDTAKYLIPDEENPAPAISKPTFNFVFSVSIGDKDAFNKLISAGQKLGSQFINSANAPFQYSSNGTYFAISNTKENADKFLAGTNSDASFISKIGGEPFAGYLNIQSLMKTFQDEATMDSTGKIAYDASLKMWDDILWKGGSMHGDVMTSSVEINLVDKSVNSLKQLNQYASKLSQLYQQKRLQEKAAIMAYDDFNNTDSSKAAK